MTRDEEIDDVSSCLNRSAPDEPVFVLCARDPAAPMAVMQWCNHRIMLGKDDSLSPKILEAAQWIMRAIKWRAENA